MSMLLYELVGADPARPFSPHVWKVALSLAHKGLAFDRRQVPFTGVPTVEGGFSRTVPVLRDGERVLNESFDIALYLDEAYPQRPSLFGGEGGRAMARFVERWSQLTVHPYLGAAAMMDIHDGLAPADRAYFRASREARFGVPLETVAARRDAGLDAWRNSLEPLRSMLSYQPYIGGGAPLFADYIVAGAFQWVRVSSPFAYLEPQDPVAAWFERCLDLHGGLLREVPAAR
jgi:glutathione S-transferase